LRGLNAKRKSLQLRLVVLAGTVLLAQAGHGVSAAEREHAAHLHGVGTLNVAIEGDEVEIELIAPGADIVGFEHAPETAADKAAVDNAVAALKNGAGLFAFPPGAGCRQEGAEVESALLDDGHSDDEEHVHGEEEEGEAHAEFHAHYRFQCEVPDRLTHMDVTYFERFPMAAELEVQAISPQGQSAGELTPSAARLKF